MFCDGPRVTDRAGEVEEAEETATAPAKEHRMVGHRCAQVSAVVANGMLTGVGAVSGTNIAEPVDREDAGVTGTANGDRGLDGSGRHRTSGQAGQGVGDVTGGKHVVFGIVFPLRPGIGGSVIFVFVQRSENLDWLQTHGNDEIATTGRGCLRRFEVIEKGLAFFLTELGTVFLKFGQPNAELFQSIARCRGNRKEWSGRHCRSGFVWFHTMLKADVNFFYKSLIGADEVSWREFAMSLRILIVDDSPAMRAHIKRVLAASGLPIEMMGEAGDGVQGLAQLRESQFNLIFSDLNMPNMNGDEFIRQVKADRMHREIPVIMVTSDNSTERVLKMSQLGCEGYICKPFNAETIKQKVLSVMGG